MEEKDKCEECKFKDVSAFGLPCVECGFGYANFIKVEESELK